MSYSIKWHRSTFNSVPTDPLNWTEDDELLQWNESVQGRRRTTPRWILYTYMYGERHLVSMHYITSLNLGFLIWRPRVLDFLASTDDQRNLRESLIGLESRGREKWLDGIEKTRGLNARVASKRLWSRERLFSNWGYQCIVIIMHILQCIEFH